MTQEQLAKLHADLADAQTRKAEAEARAMSIALDASIEDGHHRREYESLLMEAAQAERDIVRLNHAIPVAQRGAIEADPRPAYYLQRPTTNAVGEIVSAGSVYRFDGIPNIHMRPMNEAARAVKRRHGIITDGVANPG